MLPYLDIHTHRNLPHEDSVSVESLSVDKLISQDPGKDFFTAGIHPWWVEDYSSEEIEFFKNRVELLARENRPWGIGETGIDRTMPEYFDQQLNLFIWHLELAENYSLPLVIHSVRSGSDFLQIMKEKKPTTPWVFHDFRGNEALMKDLLRLHPLTCFSFGMSIDNSPQIRELLPKVPLDSLFLETDNQKHLDIHDIYLRAAECLRLDLDYLKSQIWQNFKKISRKTH